MEELTRIRNERGWSQQRLSDESGVNKATINQIERGKRSPNVETLEKLADALGVGVADFFPKAQAPLFSPEGLERRELCEPWIEFIGRYADRWEAKVRDGAFDVGQVREFADTLGDLNPIMIELGLREKREQPTGYFITFGPVMGEAIDRLMDLLDPLMEACAKKDEDSDLARLRRRREELTSHYPERRKVQGG